MTRIVWAGLLAAALSGCHRPQPLTPPAAPGGAEHAPAPSAETLFARGMELAAEGDAVRAEQYLVLAVQAGYPHERAIVPLVRVCIASARLRTALDHAQRFLRRHPDTWRLRYLTAAISLALGRPAEALDELRRVLNARPEAAQAHYLIGVTLRDAYGDVDGARESFEAYLRHAPDGVHAPEVVAWLAEHPRAVASRPAPRPLPPAASTVEATP